ncbi:MAG: hypothetical protein N2450_00310 [bacterium]|nr:hypothetical protein [bacterium]
MIPYLWICNQQQLNEVIHSYLINVNRIAIDTEFIGESYYLPKLCLIQIHSEFADTVLLIDVLSQMDLAPLFEKIVDPKIQKIIHSPKHDLAVLENFTHTKIVNVFDTQLAASFLGYGDQISLKRLLKLLLNIELSKEHQYSDWRKRPLTENQIQYAITDVYYLIHMCNQLTQQLKEKGRLEWFYEESSNLQIMRDQKYDISAKIIGRKYLKPYLHSLLKSIAETREIYSLERNIPRSIYLSDLNLIRLTLLYEKSLEASLHYLYVLEIPTDLKIMIEESIKNWIPSLEQATEKNFVTRNERVQTISEKIYQFAKTFAETHQISLPLLVTRSEINHYVKWKVQGTFDQENSLRMMKGWRYHWFGKRIENFIENELKKVEFKENQNGE